MVTGTTLTYPTSPFSKAEHGVTYDNVEMDAYRQEVWNRNADFVQRHNAEYKADRATFSVEMNNSPP